jgi:hypothetical protein
MIEFKVGGVPQLAKGNFTYNLGIPKNEAIIGSDSVHGFKSTPQVAFIEGEITDRKDLDLAALLRTMDETVTLTLGVGKVIVLYGAGFAGEGTGNSEEGNIAVRFEGTGAEEVQ